MSVLRFICTAVLIVLSVLTSVESCAGADFETWSDITMILNISDRWRYDGDQGIRGVLSGSDFTLLYFRPSLRYRVKPWFTVHGGVGFFAAFFDMDEDTFELSPWQGLQFTWPQFRGYKFTHYLRLEERIVWLNGHGSNFTLRSRYLFAATSPEFDILFKNGVFLTGSIELFWDLEKDFFDSFINRIRWNVGVGSRVLDRLRVELHYILQDGRTIWQEAFASEEHILRLRLFFRFN